MQSSTTYGSPCDFFVRQRSVPNQVAAGVSLTVGPFGDTARVGEPAELLLAERDCGSKRDGGENTLGRAHSRLRHGDCCAAGMQREATHGTRQPARATTRADLALAIRRLGAASLPRIALRSADFYDGGMLPTRSTIDGDGVPPTLSWDALTPEPASWALICQDPDAPRATPFAHWLVYGIAAQVRCIDSNLSDFHEGLNDRGQLGFAPASPPPGDGFHRYVFQLFALDTELSLPKGRDCERLLGALSGHVTAWGELVGLYQRL